MSKNWDYKANHEPTKDDIEECLQLFYQNSNEVEDPTVDFGTMSLMLIPFLVICVAYASVWLSPVTQICCVFVLLRLFAIKMMQALFYGDSFIRKLYPGTNDQPKRIRSKAGRERGSYLAKCRRVLP
mmetsp:Transcript_52835/g.78944  ORF Transcript_52835/g.78944 Transcript_52835/m.78944 type:complete len:127 (-) Transcript_52835:91-471(-)